MCLDEPGESVAGQLAFSHGKKSLKAAASRDQVDAVLDERGRPMRFHGAFTGGFSAGYWNTVGSEEGFVPRKFVSSRTQKEEAEAAADAKQKLKQMPKRSQRPEDYMDDEDVSEFGIAPRRLRARGLRTRLRADGSAVAVPRRRASLGDPRHALLVATRPAGRPGARHHRSASPASSRLERWPLHWCVCNVSFLLF